MLQNQYNLKLYGWTLHENGILTRIPESSRLEDLLYIQFESNLVYLGVPEQFKNFTEAQYLIRKPKIKVMRLLNSLNTLQKNIDYWIRQSDTGNQYEINSCRWIEQDFVINKFPELYKDWLRLRPLSFSENKSEDKKQLSIFDIL